MLFHIYEKKTNDDKIYPFPSPPNIAALGMCSNTASVTYG